MLTATGLPRNLQLSRWEAGSSPQVKKFKKGQVLKGTVKEQHPEGKWLIEFDNGGRWFLSSNNKVRSANFKEGVRVVLKVAKLNANGEPKKIDFLRREDRVGSKAAEPSSSGAKSAGVVSADPVLQKGAIVEFPVISISGITVTVYIGRNTNKDVPVPYAVAQELRPGDTVGLMVISVNPRDLAKSKLEFPDEEIPKEADVAGKSLPPGVARPGNEISPTPTFEQATVIKVGRIQPWGCEPQLEYKVKTESGKVYVLPQSLTDGESELSQGQSVSVIRIPLEDYFHGASESIKRYALCCSQAHYEQVQSAGVY